MTDRQRQMDRGPPYMADTLTSNLQMHIYCHWGLFSCIATVVEAGQCAPFIKSSLFWLFNGQLKGCFVQHWDRMCLVSVYLSGLAAAAAPSGLALFDMESW